MTRWIVGGLVVLNLLLGGAVWLRLGGERKAEAQIGGGGGNVAVISGYSGGQSIVYMLETTSGELIAVKADPVNRQVALMSRRNVGADLRPR